MKPTVSYVIYKPLPGRENELSSLMQEYIAALNLHGFTTGRDIVLGYQPEGYIIKAFEWIDNNDDLEERAANHSEVRPIKVKMNALAVIPDMKEIKKIRKELRDAIR